MYLVPHRICPSQLSSVPASDSTLLHGSDWNAPQAPEDRLTAYGFQVDSRRINSFMAGHCPAPHFATVASCRRSRKARCWTNLGATVGWGSSAASTTGIMVSSVAVMVVSSLLPALLG